MPNTELYQRPAGGLVGVAGRVLVVLPVQGLLVGSLGVCR
jgi:hypothetical protein